LSWFDPSGQEMSDEAWSAGFVRSLGVRLAGDLIGDLDARGEPIVGDTLLVLLNAHHEPIAFKLPITASGQHWECLLDTANPDLEEEAQWQGGTAYQLEGRSLGVLSTQREQPGEEQLPASQAQSLAPAQTEVPQPNTSLPAALAACDIISPQG